MARFNLVGTLKFNPKFKKTMRKLKKEAQTQNKDDSISNIDKEVLVAIDGQIAGTEETTLDPNDSFSESDVEKNMTNNQAIQDINIVDNSLTTLHYIFYIKCNT